MAVCVKQELLLLIVGGVFVAEALSVLAHKLGRTFYHLLHTKEVFDVNRFVRH